MGHEIESRRGIGWKLLQEKVNFDKIWVVKHFFTKRLVTLM
jgi:hypothetical protein